MNDFHIHLLVNHFPIVGVILATLILLAGILLRNKTVQVVGLFTMFFSGIAAFIAHITGERAEHAADDATGFSHDALEFHEHASEPFFQGMVVVGILSLVTLFLLYRKSVIGNYLTYFILVGGIVCSVLAKKAGESGGAIRHPELGIEVPAEQEEEEH